MKRVEIIAKGDVQRVGCRDVVEHTARTLKLTGFVENSKPYDIRIIAEGEEDVLNEFVNQIRITQHPLSPISVEDLDIKFEAAIGEFEYSEIKRDDWQGELGERLDLAGALMYRSMELAVRMDDALDTLLHATAKSSDIATLNEELVGEIRAQISTLQKERLLLFEKKMLSGMYEEFEQYDSALQKTLEKFPYEKSVFIMMPFGENDIRLRIITDTIKETLEEHSLCGWRADDLERSLMEDMWPNIVVNMLSCKYGIAVYVDRTLLDRYTDEQVTVFNANIALEVGFMKSRGLDVLLLKDKRLEKLHTDIISKLYEEFDFDDPEGCVKKSVTDWIKKRQLGDNAQFKER